MSLLRRTRFATAAFCLLAATTTPVAAQSDAEQALDDARQAYAEGRFDSARDRLITASQTDPKNPDVHLLLGKAYYQLGEVEDALAAWRTTLRLAPQQAYAKRMLEVLTGQALDVDTRLKVVQALLADRLFKPVPSELAKIRSHSLSNDQRLRLLQLEAEFHLGTDKPQFALQILSELAVRYPEKKAEPSTRFLVARAQVAAGGETLATGLALLQTLAALEPQTPLAAAAELELLAFQLRQGTTDVDALLEWIEGHANHAKQIRARAELIAAIQQLLTVTTQAPAPKPEAGLSDTDRKALAAATAAFAAMTTAAEADALTTLIVSHLQEHYAARGALEAAQAGLAELEKIEMLPSSARLLASARRQLDVQLATAEYSKITTRLAQNLDATAELKKWIVDHPDHPQLGAARQSLLDWYLAATLRQKAPTNDSPLAATDVSAIDVAADIYAANEIAANALKLTERIASHIEKRYVAAGALAAAHDGFQKLLAIQIPVTSRARALHGLAGVQTGIALKKLSVDATEQRIVGGELPDELKAVLATYAEINTLVPAAQTWKQQAAMASQVTVLSAHLAWPARPTSPKPTQSWGLEIALPVIADGSNAEAVKMANATVDGIIQQLVSLPQPSADGLGVTVHARLLAVLPEGENAWVVAMLKRAELLEQHAKRIFDRNIVQGRHDANAVLSAPQRQLIATLKTLVEAKPSQTAAALARIEAAMAHCLAAGHFGVAQAAYASIKDSLPERQQFGVELAMIRLSVQQILLRDTRALEKGFQIEAKLDPQLAEALLRIYELQRGVPNDDERLTAVRAVGGQVAAHYRGLEMFDIAAQAISTKAEEAVPVADKYAEFQLAGLQLFLAQRELARLLTTFGGREAITFTAAFKTAQTAWEEFIVKHPSDPLAARAVEQLFGIGQLFESHQRGKLAATVYGNIEEFAADIEPLNQVAIGQPTVPERAALAAATALHTHATRALEKQLAKQPADAAPPEAVSKEFIDALAAYQAIIGNYPDRPLVKTAIEKTLAIGLQYAMTGAWDVADSVYEGFLAQMLSLRRPERIEFARAISQLGKVMPAHAQQVLSTLSQIVPQGEGHRSDDGKDIQIAGLDYDDLLRSMSDAEYESIAGAFGGGGGGGQFRPRRPPADPFGGPVAGNGPAGGRPAADQPANPQDPAAAETAPAQTAEPQSQGQAQGEGQGQRLSAEELADAQRRADLIAAVQRHQGNQALQIARLRDAAIQFQMAQQQDSSQIQFASAVLSEAELERQQRLLDATYKQLQALRTRYPTGPTAEQARSEILIIVNHWRGLSKWERSAQLAARFLEDNPRDRELPKLRQEIARDYLAWAAQGVEPNGSKQEMLDTVNGRFETARSELKSIVTDFPDNGALRHQAQWDIANSFLTQARVVATLSQTLARGQFVRSANELMQVAELYHDHPQIGSVPQMLANIAGELAGRGYHDEAISVWNLLSIKYPTHGQGQQAALHIAQTYQSQNQPLKAVEAYVELNFARGGHDQGMQNSIYSIGTALMGQKRWIEALHVFETFVDSFPQHGQAGQALTMIGQIHQTNEVWEDAITAYDRVITEYGHCQWVKQARWSIAECTINLSRWRDAIENYRKFAEAYAEDPQTAQATDRIEILKNLERYQDVVDEEGQRKSFDAQYQIAEIVRQQLSNRVKAIIEYRKVATNWPESHLADDALYQVGVTYLSLGEPEQAREALLAAAEKYPGSPLADDALFMVGRSYEDEAQKFAAVTRVTSAAEANDSAQREAYTKSQALRLESRGRQQERVSQLKRAGKFEEADEQVAASAALNKAYDFANAQVLSKWAAQEAEAQTAAQLADRQDKVNAALRKAVGSYRRAASLVSGDKADDALLRMAQIYDQQLKDADAAMETWLEIVKQFSGTSVAEDASWKIAQYYEQHTRFAEAIDAYKAFLRNYRRSPKAGAAQAAIAENFEQLGKWVEAMDAYTNYVNNFPEGPRVRQAKQQISWIKTYRL